MEKINFVSGGKTGDLLHTLMVVKSICESQNKKAILYITNVSSYGGDNFHFDMHKTYYDLEPIIMSQPYIDSFHLLRVDDVIGNYINLNLWRKSVLIFNTNWINLLRDTYAISGPSEPWVTYNKSDGLEDTILIHRSLHRQTSTFPWEKIVKENKCTFITNNTTLHEYENFKFKNDVDLISCESFSDLVTSINSCKFFIGNMSTPLALSHCLGKPHLGELITPDNTHYIGEERYITDYFYINDNGMSNIEGIERFINL